MLQQQMSNLLWRHLRNVIINVIIPRMTSVFESTNVQLTSLWQLLRRNILKLNAHHFHYTLYIYIPFTVLTPYTADT